jgi:pimeloyl-ACP methyl ester carboxylesterase
MAIVYTEDYTAAPANYPKMNLLYATGQTYLFHTRINYDSSWPQGAGGRPIVGYLHGSGATGHLTGNLLDALIAKGFVVVSLMALGYGASSREPFVYGYGNVNSPHFMGHFIKDGFWAEAVYTRINAINTSLNGGAQPVMLMGQSMGSTAAVAWASGMALRTGFAPAFRGIVVNAPTGAGLGNGAFNHMPRMLSTMTAMVERIQCRSVLMFGDLDVYAPPEYARRVQSSIPEGKDIYVIAPGNYDHNWMGSVAGAPQAANWADQIMRGATILDRFGRPATAGPAA